MATPNSTPSTNLFGPTQATRVRTFVHFFKSYMSVGALLVAALPIPVASFKLIPTFEAQRKYLSVYTSMFCFLSLGFIFFQRHHLGAYMFRRPMLLNTLLLRQGPISPSLIAKQMVSSGLRAFVTWLPLGCIVLSIFAVFHYHSLFDDAVLVAQAQDVAEKQRGTLGVAFLADIAKADRFFQVNIANAVLKENAKMRIIPGEPDNKSSFQAPVSGITPVESEMKATIAEASDAANDVEALDVPVVNGYNGIVTHPFSLAEREAKKYLANKPSSFAGSFSDARKFIGAGVNVPDPGDVLKTKTVPLSMDLMFWYLTIFVSAETAFILMALKEYLQDLAHISDLTLMGMGDESTQWQSPSPS